METAKKAAEGAEAKKKATRQDRIERTRRLLEKQAEQAEKLRQKKAELEKRLAKLAAPDEKAKRKRNDHRKFLLGSMVLTKVRIGEIKEQQVVEWLESFLTRPEDRAVFFGENNDGLILQEE